MSGSGGLGPGFGGSGTPVMFAKRKRNIFKGPMLSFGNNNGSGASGRSASGGSSGAKHSHSRSASASGLGRRSGEITIEEEDEEEEEMEDMEEGDEDEDEAAANGHAAISRFLLDENTTDDIEEVDQFSPIIQGPGELIEEIYEDDEGDEDTPKEEEDMGEPGDDVGRGKLGVDVNVNEAVAVATSSPSKTHADQAVSAAT